MKKRFNLLGIYIMRLAKEVLEETRRKIEARRKHMEETSAKQLAENEDRRNSKLNDDLARIEEQRQRCLELLKK